LELDIVHVKNDSPVGIQITVSKMELMLKGQHCIYLREEIP